MLVTLQYFDGCPNTQTAEERLRGALDRTGHPDTTIDRQRVESVEDAERLQFIGSPTILVDGADLFPEPGARPALACRMYRTDEGLRGSPTQAQLERALG